MLVFPYRGLPASQPAITLAGRLTRPRPLIGVSLVSPQGIFSDLCLLDTGADDTVFPEIAANRLGLDLSQAPSLSVVRVGGPPILVRYAAVELRITDGTDFASWEAMNGFSSMTMKHPLLGYAGFMQYFTVTFRGADEVVELERNRLYPGS